MYVLSKVFCVGVGVMEKVIFFCEKVNAVCQLSVKSNQSKICKIGIGQCRKLRL